MPDSKSRTRVERLLGDEFRPDDLSNLFLYLRDHCDGREPVIDIGHFTAHHNERDRGIITRSTREWFATARYHFYGVAAGGHGYAQRLPPVTQDYFRIAVNRIDAKWLRDKTGLKHSEAHKIMSKLADRLIQNPDATWALPSICTPNELRLVQFVSQIMVVKTAFEAERLAEDFLAALKSNALITKDEIRAQGDALKTLVQLYAVAAMHNCVVQVGDGSTVQLKAGWSDPSVKTKIEVTADVPVMPQVNLRASMFGVQVDPVVHCHPDLLTGEPWDFEIELAPDKRVSPLR